MDKKVVVITGSSDGIGAAAAKMLVEGGHEVVIVGRNPEKTAKVAVELGAKYFIADFARLDDVVVLAKALLKYSHIDVLANNAGAAMNARKMTSDGFEQTFQVNVLAPFLLTYMLLPRLCESGATVVQTSSIAANLFGRSFDVKDLQNEKYTAVKAYGRAKLCNVLFTRELHKRYKDLGINAVAFHPGIPRTNFACESVRFLRVAYHSGLKYIFTTKKERSARRLVHFVLATPGKDFVRGGMYGLRGKYRIRYKDPDGVISAALWNACESMIQPWLK